MGPSQLTTRALPGGFLGRVLQQRARGGPAGGARQDGGHGGTRRGGAGGGGRPRAGRRGDDSRQLTAPQAGPQPQESVPQQDESRTQERSGLWRQRARETPPGRRPHRRKHPGVQRRRRRGSPRQPPRATHLGEVATGRQRGRGCVRVCVCVHVCTWVCVHACAHVGACAFVLCVCMCMCAHVCVYLCAACVCTCEHAGWGQAGSGGSRRAGVPRAGKPTGGPWVQARAGWPEPGAGRRAAARRAVEGSPSDSAISTCDRQKEPLSVLRNRLFTKSGTVSKPSQSEG